MNRKAYSDVDVSEQKKISSIHSDWSSQLQPSLNIIVFPVWNTIASNYLSGTNLLSH